MHSSQQLELPRKIIYIMGPGRCGTTLLDVLLSNTRGISGCGELTHIFRDGFISNHLCSCGKPACDCDVWSSLLKTSRWSRADIAQLSKLFSFFSSHRLFPMILLGLTEKARRIEYDKANEILFSAVADTTHSEVIVDSSKYAGRALALTAQFKDRISIIAMTREPTGVLRSFSKIVAEQEPKSTLSTLLYYCYVLLCMRLVCWRRGRQVMKVTYESLCASPLEILSEIEKFCDIDLKQTKARLESDIELEIGHIVTGNRLRHQPTIKFRCKPEKSDISAGAQLAAILMHGWRKLLQL